MDPCSFSSRGPVLCSGEFQALGTIRICFESDFLRLHDNRELLIVEIEVELHILDSIVDVGVDVVIQQVLVDAAEDEELTHRGDQAFVAFEVQRAAGRTEFLEVTDLAERAVVRIGDEAADNMPGGTLHDGLESNLGDILSIVLEELALVNVLIPRIHTPDASCGRSADGSRSEGLAVAVRNLAVAGVVVEERLAGGGTHVHETTDGDFPTLGSRVSGTFDGYGLVRLELGIPLVTLIIPGITPSVLRDRNEVDHFERVVVVFASGTVGAQAVADVSFPDIQVLDEFLCESLQGEAAAQIFGGDRCGELCVLCIRCQRAGDGYDRTVGGECKSFRAAIDDGLVGKLAFFVSVLDQVLGDGYEVLVHAFAIFRTVCDSDFVLVIAVAVGIGSRIDGLDDDVVFLTFADGYQRVGCEIDVIGHLIIGVTDLDGCRNRAGIFPSCIDVGSDRNDRVDRYFVLFNVRSLGAAGEEKCTNNHHQKK